MGVGGKKKRKRETKQIKHQRENISSTQGMYDRPLAVFGAVFAMKATSLADRYFSSTFLGTESAERAMYSKDCSTFSRE